MSSFGDLFDGVAPATRADLAAVARRRTFPPGADLFTIGEMPAFLYRVRSGRVKAWWPSKSGEALTLGYFGPGDVLGLVAVSRRELARVSMTAVSRTETESWPAATIYRLLDDDASLSHNGLRMVGQLLELLIDRVEDSSTANTEQRIGRALLRVASEHATLTDDHETSVDLSRQDIADLTGSTLFTASRVLREWDRQGLVKSMRGRVVIRDPESLAAIADT